jgi:hypothetical protein
MNRAAAFIEKLTEVQRIAGHLLAHLQASEHDKFGSSLPIAPGIPVRLGARRKRRQQIERCVISTFRVAENMGPVISTFRSPRAWDSKASLANGSQSFVHSSSAKGFGRDKDESVELEFNLLTVKRT